MDQATRQAVRRRAGNRCEYCHMPGMAVRDRFSIDHVIATKHAPSDAIANLAMACLHCNLHKGSDLSSIDPEGGGFTRLFNPRLDQWAEHFAWRGAIIVGLTAAGRATVRLLQMNALHRVRFREDLRAEGVSSE
jgi:hypothetical protein